MSNFMKKVLMHTCCAPCSVYCVDSLRKEGIEPTIFWYNPNVHPYLEYKMPVLCVTDPNCDMGSIASENGFGMWAPSNSVEAFSQCVSDILKKDIASMGENGYRYLKQNYLVEHSYSQIMKHFSNNV